MSGVARPFTANGVEYSSVSEAARQLGLSRQTLHKRIMRAKSPDVYTGTDRKPREEPTVRKKRTGQGGHIDGVFYTSICDASRATGIPRDSVKYLFDQQRNALA